MLSWLFKRKAATLAKDFHRQIDPEALDIVRNLQRAGHESYLVGGCVRDILLGKHPKDFDIATAATPQQVKSLIKRAFIIGRRFRIVVAKRRMPYSELKKKADELFPLHLGRPPEKEFQITTFRREPVVVNGEVNENVFGSPKDDAYRRDFTINGLFLDPVSGRIQDFVGGLNDISKKRLRVIGDPAARFREDPIRMLRAIRFAARAGVKIEATTQAALKANFATLGSAKKERVREEVLKILKEGSPDKVLHHFEEVEGWKYVNPGLYEHHRHHPESERQLERVARAIAQTGWKNPQSAAPLFYLMLSDLVLAHRHNESIVTILDDFKVSRLEREDMQRITLNLRRIEHDPNCEHAHRVLVRNPRYVASQIQAFYALKILADAEIQPWNTLWPQWRKAWTEHLSFIRSAHRMESEEARGPESGAGRSRSRRSRRRRGPAPMGAPAAPSSSGSDTPT